MLLPGHLLTSDWRVAMMRASTKSEVPQVALQDDRKNSADGHSDWEQNLPEFLQESIQAMVSAWDKLDRGEEYYLWDCDYCSLQSDINSAEVNRKKPPASAAATQNGTGSRAVFIEIFCSDRQSRSAVIL